MKRKNILSILAFVVVLALALAGCGSEKAPESTAAADITNAAAPELGLSDWSMTATTWSSPNGATINLTATPYGYAESQTASFVVRLEGEEVASIPCQWDGTHYTASAELNAADGLCYYVLMTTADGNTAEVPVNTPTVPTDESLINLASSLQSYCNLTVTESNSSGSKLTITNGSAQIQLPRITNDGETIVCDKAVLVLTFDGREVDSAELKLPEASDSGSYTLDLTGTGFKIPEMEDDQQLSLRLDVTLSNNQTLTAPGCTWFYLDGGLMLAVG